MRIALIVQHPFLPEITAGGILDLHHLALELVREGHRPEVVATRYGSRRLLPQRLAQRLRPRHPMARTDDALGYRVTRYGDWIIRAGFLRRLDRGDWDVVELQDVSTFDLIRPVHERGIPLLIRIVAMQEVAELARRAAADRGFAAILRDPHVRVISNSVYVAGEVRRLLGLETPVVYPPIDFASCVAATHAPVDITMVNPRDVKGIDTTLAVAALLPHRTFLLQEAWALDPHERTALLDRIRGLPHVRLAPVTDRMAEVYRTTALLLVPSRVVETFGRVALEAAANGIPVVASRSGGLPEAVGPGGVLVDPDAPAAVWAQAVERVVADRDRHDAIAAQAIAHAGDPRFDQRDVAARIVALAEKAVSGMDRGSELTH